MTRERALPAVVLLHLAITVMHGRAHAGAQVLLPLARTVFVVVVIVAGPLVGLGVSRWRPPGGAWVVAGSMGGALVFGVINHFVVAGSDHVAHVVGQWGTTFGVTAALLVVSETVGVAVGVWSAVRTDERAP